MNLMHLITKRDENVVLGGGVTKIKRSESGRSYSGLRLEAGGTVRLRSALRWYPFRTRPSSTNWLAVAARSAASRNPPVLNVAFEDPAGSVISSESYTVQSSSTLIRLPNLLKPHTIVDLESFSLSLENASKEAIDLLITETISPDPLYELATGTGVEIGPGPYPRILPDPTRTVFYVERETADEFMKKYNFTGKFESLDSPEAKDFWAKIIVGRANDLPFDDGSLDFVFSADVIEHLVNPLGHLKYWSKKLAPGGKVLAIIPHIYGCSDYVNSPTQFDRWEQELQKGGFEETVEHHIPFCEPRGLDPKALFQKGYSSHFSFFSTENLSHMLSYAVREFGYVGYDINYGLNSKKIQFALYT